MKLLKTRFAAVLLMGTVMFSLFSFTTIQVAAQETSSNTLVTINDDKALASFARLLGNVFYSLTVCQILMSPPQRAATNYPTDALD